MRVFRNNLWRNHLWRSKSGGDAPPEYERSFTLSKRGARAIESLRRGRWVDDAFFDRIYPDWVQDRSRLHWTPIPVIHRAVEILTEEKPDARILDAGSGCGKFCVVGALLNRQARFAGVEQRPHFVRVAQEVARFYDIPRAYFACANLEEIDWSRYDGIYLYNPFQEHRTPLERIDSSIKLGDHLYRRYVVMTREKLRTLRPGTRVVTYHGFGGTIPEGFELLLEEYCYRGPLEAWVKR